MERSIAFILNGKATAIEVDDERMLLWVLRYDLGLTGAKFGCGTGICGACTVIVDNQAVRSCSLPVKEIAGKKVTDHRGAEQGRASASHPGSLRQAQRLSVRLLHPGHDYERLCASAEEAAAHRGRDRPPHGRQPVPLRSAGSDRRGHSGCGRGDERTGVMQTR